MSFLLCISHTWVVFFRGSCLLLRPVTCLSGRFSSSVAAGLLTPGIIVGWCCQPAARATGLTAGWAEAVALLIWATVPRYPRKRSRAAPWAETRLSRSPAIARRVLSAKAGPRPSQEVTSAGQGLAQGGSWPGRGRCWGVLSPGLCPLGIPGLCLPAACWRCSRVLREVNAYSRSLGVELLNLNYAAFPCCGCPL